MYESRPTFAKPNAVNRISSFHFPTVIDLNHILLFIACVSPLVMLAQTLRRGGLFRPWRLACVVVLLVTAGAWFVNSNTAGFFGAGAWLALLLVPAVGIRRMSELA